MKNTQKILFLTLNIWLLNITPSFSQSNSIPLINRPTLQIGSQGNSVSELQGVLKLLGYYQGSINGKYSEDLKLAIMAFQKAANIPTTGITDQLTWATLLPLNPPDNTVSINSNNSSTNKPLTNSQTNNNSSTNKPLTNSQTNNNSSTNKPPTNSQTNNNSSTNKPPTNSQTNNNSSTNKPPTNSQNTTKQPELLAANMPLLKEGMEGENVKILQQRLKILGFFSGTIDGIFGLETLAAVIEAQGKFNLGADGVVGLQTWKALLGQ